MRAYSTHMTETVSSRRRKPARWRSLVLVGGLISLGVCVILAFLLTRPARAIPIPMQVAGYPLRAHLFGPDAAREIRDMHRGTFPLTGAAIGIYGNRDATVWVSEIWGEWGAALLMHSMTKAIARVDSPFEPVGERLVDGIQVYELTGMGQAHFYFRVRNQVYWLAIRPTRAEAGLRDILAFAKGIGR